jgi:hypothetical protein
MRFILLILQVDALPKTLEMQESAHRKGHSALCSILLYYVSCETVLWQSSIGPCRDKAARYRSWSVCCLARFGLVCSCIAPVLRFCCDGHWVSLAPSPSTVPSCQQWKQTMILNMAYYDNYIRNSY